jgi:uncharacterized tellurite resistance protein B-like protein
MRGPATWIPSGGSFTIDGRNVAGDLVYVGRVLPSASRMGVDPALIDPSLKIGWRHPDSVGQTMGYWPSYSAITPQGRAAYLNWLADGRSDPRAYIGYVFLFFYGLERRVLVDLGVDSNHPDVTAAVAEVKRLLRIYGYNGSFRGYATDFLEFAEARDVLRGSLEPPNLDSLDHTWEVPLVVRVALGRFVAAGTPIPAGWALSWLRTDPISYLRTAATRCADEFDDLFRARYRQRYGEGMVIRPTKARIELSYRPASAGFGGHYEATLGDLPDVTKTDGPIGKLKELASECTDALAAYSRHLGRDPQGRGTAAAVGLLPEELLARHGGGVVSELKTWVAKLLAEQATATVTIDDIVARWSPGRTAKLTKTDTVGMAGLLAKLGAGMEPDVRFGGSTPKPGTRVVLFRLTGHAPAAPSEAYSTAALLVRLAAVLAAADGTVTDDERRHLAVHLEAVLGLDVAERTRLEAALEWLATEKTGLGGLKRRVEALDTKQREAIGRFLVDVAAADGQVTPDEITMLTKLYRLLGLDEADVYRFVHALEAGDTGPVTVRPADSAGDRWSIPPRPVGAGTSSGVRLDEAKIAARREETAAVAALLSDIFVDEAEPAAALPDAIPQEPGSVPGLDPAHASLVEALRTQARWDRAELESAAAERGLLMLDGAIERINDAVIEVCGEPLIEGDDPLEVNDYAVQELA